MRTQDIKPGLMVRTKGTDSEHLGIVDHLDGSRFIRLSRTDSKDGEHHWIPLEWVDKVDENAVFLNCSKEEFALGLMDSLPVGTQRTT